MLLGNPETLQTVINETAEVRQVTLCTWPLLMLRTLLAATSVSDNVEARQSRMQQFVGENTDELRSLHVPVRMCGMHVCVFMCCMCVCVCE